MGLDKQEEDIWYNCWKIHCSLPYALRYAYLDCKDFHADKLFEEEGIKVRVRQEMSKMDESFCLVFCEIRKKDDEKFRNVIKKLLDDMLLLGYDDYPKVCKELTATFRNGR